MNSKSTLVQNYMLQVMLEEQRNIYNFIVEAQKKVNFFMLVSVKKSFYTHPSTITNLSMFDSHVTSHLSLQKYAHVDGPRGVGVCHPVGRNK